MKYQVWMEGFVVMEGHATAEYLGEYEADSFLEACKKAADNHPGYGGYNQKTNRIWGCQLFDNEIDARKGFG
jgi:hypothetical protein